MNIKTCEALARVIDITREDKVWSKYLRYSIDNRKSQGQWFYKMKIVITSSKKVHILRRFEKIGLLIGSLNGEGLANNLEKNTLRLS